MKKQKIYKHFCIQPYQANFTKARVTEYLESLDNFLEMNGKLVTHFHWRPLMSHLKENEPLQFEDLYDILSRWATSPEQNVLNYDDFNKELIDVKNQLHTTEDFKKMTDH